ncbi:hypothetical protein RRG08_023518 [Elysia crispata]|uniref:Ionotropic glutamate receptor C-terminal domain-containing protein n=1 Tax=Elysia crispata TaxID=231223 RepID=A0AAE0YYQ9_9GAST|nr:hypothetical protein RRG08_023518 [Elysia crispata]
MVMVLLTGHTINVKAPKSWPGKVIQNVWAGLAIFIMTSYTANLAAYLAGQSVVTTVNSVFDPETIAKQSLESLSSVQAETEVRRKGRDWPVFEEMERDN